MGEADDVVAQLVMKRPDGTSILDTRGTAGHGDVSPERAAKISDLLKRCGFDVLSGNLNTLSITGSDALFAETFGMSPSAALEKGTPAHATKIPAELSDFVADVFVTPAPDFFP